MADLTVLDASVLLAHFDDTDPHSDDAAAILTEADELGASTMTLAEVLVGAARAGRLEQQLAAINQLQIAELPLQRSTAPELVRLRVDTGLRMPDCCVLHAALTSDAQALATRDTQLARAATAHGLETP